MRRKCRSGCCTRTYVSLLIPRVLFSLVLYEFRKRAEAKAVERKQRAREDVERISGVRQTSVEL